MGDTYALFFALAFGFIAMILVGAFADRLLLLRLIKLRIHFLVALAINTGLVVLNYFLEDEFEDWLSSTDSYSDLADPRQPYVILALVILLLNTTLKYLVYRFAASNSSLKLWLILLIPGLFYSYLWWYLHFG